MSDRERRLSILVVDDDTTFLRSLELVLEETHDVTPCSLYAAGVLS